MSISRKDVEHIARLARIKLTPGEGEKFEQELSAILGFVAKLNAVDAATIGPLTGGTALENVMREDNVGQQEAGSMNQDLVAAAPRKRSGYVEVEAVFERE